MAEKLLKDLEPKLVWSIFEEITKVPRPSKKEEKIRLWVKNWAKKNKIKTIKEDTTGNVLLGIDASQGCEDFPTLVIQAHMDMVCQKDPNVKIDFENDPLKILIEDNKVLADGTSLGADNGIGMAFGLASLIDKDIKHGPLEVLLTVDEETGLTGAFGVKAGFFTGKYLLNVDSESIGKITISSAGGGGTDFSLPIKIKEQKDCIGYKLIISGLQGGHSGVDIDLPKLNAIKVGIDAFVKIIDNVMFKSIAAGSAHNAIPRDFICEFIIPKKKQKQVINELNKWKKKTISIARKTEPEISITIAKEPLHTSMSEENSKAILNLLLDIKHGPISYNQEIAGLVQTSSNLATIKTDQNEIQVHVSTRSSINNELEHVRSELKDIGKKYNFNVTLDKAYPGWSPTPNAPFVQLTKKSYEEILGEKVELLAIHAGLECGLFIALDSDLQVSSIGPNIKNAHSPDEFIEIPSVKIIYNVVKKVIENMGTLS